MIDLYTKGQSDLIDKIKEDITKLVDSEPEGFDLALDILFLLKNIKPLESYE